MTGQFLDRKPYQMSQDKQNRVSVMFQAKQDQIQQSVEPETSVASLVKTLFILSYYWNNFSVKYWDLFQRNHCRVQP